MRQGKKSLAIAVDEILGERELVLKSLDNTVAYPPYVAGCTVLGSGEVIPVLLPDAFDQLLASPEQPQASSPAPEQPKRQPTILVIDDSVAVRRTLNKLLNQVGYQVQQCRMAKKPGTSSTAQNRPLISQFVTWKCLVMMALPSCKWCGAKADGIIYPS